jgi:hypothetical protein
VPDLSTLSPTLCLPSSQTFSSTGTYWIQALHGPAFIPRVYRRTDVTTPELVFSQIPADVRQNIATKLASIEMAAFYNNYFKIKSEDMCPLKAIGEEVIRIWEDVVGADNVPLLNLEYCMGPRPITLCFSVIPPRFILSYHLTQGTIGDI